MIRKPIKSGGHIYILNEGETCPAGEACFTADEWQWCEKILSDSYLDKEAKKEFFLTVLEKKRTLPGYILFIDFPKDVVNQKKDNPGLEICAEIMRSLRRSVKPEGEIK